jgi:hypothetical protein
MKKNFLFKGGVRNPLNLENAHFDYEVVDFGEEVKTVEYEETDGSTCTYPENTILIKSLSGGRWSSNEFFAKVIMDDALKTLRKGELISANLKFRVVKDDDGNYQQRVMAEDIYTLNDYQQIREAETRYQEQLTVKNPFED